MNFDDFNIGDEIKEAIGDMGFTKTTPIQSRAIPDALKGIDIIGQAQTGSGAFQAVNRRLFEFFSQTGKKIWKSA